MPLTKPLAYQHHPHLHHILTLSSDDGWVSVGQKNDVSCRQHWIAWSKTLAIQCGENQSLQPFLTVGHARYAMTRGWYGKRKINDERLRLPAELLKNHATHDLNKPLSNLNAYEAQTLCELNFGRLATEKKEVDAICQYLHLNRQGLEQVWTASYWSEWSYALCVHQDGRWYASQQVLHEEKAYRSVFSLTATQRSKQPAEQPLVNTGAILVYDLA